MPNNNNKDNNSNQNEQKKNRKKKVLYQFMVDFTLPEILNDRFQSLIPNQRAKINTYFSQGHLVSYSVSLESGKCWAVFRANDDLEVLEMVEALPLTRYMEYDIAPLTFHNTFAPLSFSFSLN